MTVSTEKLFAWRTALGRLDEEIAMHRLRLARAAVTRYRQPKEAAAISDDALRQIATYEAKQESIREKLARAALLDEDR